MAPTVTAEAGLPRQAGASRPLWRWAVVSLAAHGAALLLLIVSPLDHAAQRPADSSRSDTTDAWFIDTWQRPPSISAKPIKMTSPVKAAPREFKGQPGSVHSPDSVEQSAEPKTVSKRRPSSPQTSPPSPKPTRIKTWPRDWSQAPPSEKRPAKGVSHGDSMGPAAQVASTAASRTPTTKPPAPDALVERLMARERQKARQRRQARASAGAASDRTQPRPSIAASAVSPKKQAAKATSEPPASSGTSSRRALSTALVRALPAVASLNSNLVRASAPQVKTRFSVALTAGKLVELTTPRGLDFAPQRLLERTARLLTSGRYYSAADRSLAEGVHVFDLLLRRSQSAPRDTIALGHSPPEAGQPGTGFFIASDGLRLDAVLQARGNRVPPQLRRPSARVFRL